MRVDVEALVTWIKATKACGVVLNPADARAVEDELASTASYVPDVTPLMAAPRDVLFYVLGVPVRSSEIVEAGVIVSKSREAP